MFLETQKPLENRWGGDIISNKKTILYLLALGQGSSIEAEALEHLFSICPKDPKDKIAAVKEIFLTSGAAEATRAEIEKYSNVAFSLLEEINISKEKKQMLLEFGNNLMQRNV